MGMVSATYLVNEVLQFLILKKKKKKKKKKRKLTKA